MAFDKLLLSGFNPLFFLRVLASWTVPVTTRIVTNRFVIAMAALADMTTKGFGSTQRNCSERFLYLNHRTIFLLILLAVKMDYVR